MECATVDLNGDAKPHVSEVDLSDDTPIGVAQREVGHPRAYPAAPEQA